MANILNWDREKNCVINFSEEKKEDENNAGICMAGQRAVQGDAAEQSVMKQPIIEQSTVKQETFLEETKVYLAQDIQNFLGIGRSRCYTYLEEVYKEQKPFRVIKIGKLFRIPKQSFDNWLNGCG